MLAIRGATAGMSHPRNTEALNQIAVSQLARQRLAEALPLLLLAGLRWGLLRGRGTSHQDENEREPR